MSVAWLRYAYQRICSRAAGESRSRSDGASFWSKPGVNVHKAVPDGMNSAANRPRP